jgi:hypothetical protein
MAQFVLEDMPAGQKSTETWMFDVGLNVDPEGERRIILK